MHWSDNWPDETDTYGMTRSCDRCGKTIDMSHEFAWCDDCIVEGCAHGNKPHECNECDHEADVAFDAAREQSIFRGTPGW